MPRPQLLMQDLPALSAAPLALAPLRIPTGVQQLEETYEPPEARERRAQRKRTLSGAASPLLGSAGVSTAAASSGPGIPEWGAGPRKASSSLSAPADAPAFPPLPPPRSRSSTLASLPSFAPGAGAAAATPSAPSPLLSALPSPLSTSGSAAAAAFSAAAAFPPPTAALLPPLLPAPALAFSPPAQRAAASSASFVTLLELLRALPPLYTCPEDHLLLLCKALLQAGPTAYAAGECVCWKEGSSSGSSSGGSFALVESGDMTVYSRCGVGRGGESVGGRGGMSWVLLQGLLACLHPRWLR